MADIVLPTDLLIDGAFVAGEGDPERVLNPSTGELLLALPEASVEQVHKAVSAAHRAAIARRPLPCRRQKARPRPMSKPAT